MSFLLELLPKCNLLYFYYASDLYCLPLFIKRYSLAKTMFQQFEYHIICFVDRRKTSEITDS